jgi:uncharacterized protein YbcI
MQAHLTEDPAEPIEQPIPVIAEISREMVRIYKEQFDRGPTTSRTAFAGPDTVICTLEHTLTPVERKLVELGEHQRLRDVRLFFHHATEAQFREVIERLLGREVRAFVSGMDVETDVSDEIFRLVPLDPAGYSSAEPKPTEHSRPEGAGEQGTRPVATPPRQQVRAPFSGSRRPDRSRSDRRW